jgi:hypothetical protein
MTVRTKRMKAGKEALDCAIARYWRHFLSRYGYRTEHRIQIAMSYEMSEK